MHSKKGFALTLIVAILAVLAIGAFLFVTKNKKVEAPVINIPEFTEKDFKDGFYYGSFNQKRNGTPDSWIHSGDGTRSSMWYDPVFKGNSTTTNPVACTMDAMMCPDGTYVGRSAPDCKFICPVVKTRPDAGQGSFCGGIAGIKCASGLTCKYDGAYPDAGGKCVK